MLAAFPLAPCPAASMASSQPLSHPSILAQTPPAHSLCLLLFSAPVDGLGDFDACHRLAALDMHQLSASLGFDLPAVLDVVESSTGLARARAWHCVREAVRSAMDIIPGPFPSVAPDLHSMPSAWLLGPWNAPGAARRLTVFRFTERFKQPLPNARARVDARFALGLRLARLHGGFSIDLPMAPFSMDGNTCEIMRRAADEGFGRLESAQSKAALLEACPAGQAVAPSLGAARL